MERSELVREAALVEKLFALCSSYATWPVYTSSSWISDLFVSCNFFSLFPYIFGLKHSFGINTKTGVYSFFWPTSTLVQLLTRNPSSDPNKLVPAYLPLKYLSPIYLDTVSRHGLAYGPNIRQSSYLQLLPAYCLAVDTAAISIAHQPITRHLV